MQYELKGNKKQGKGPIIACCDNSGSMAGDREIWSKAVILTLLEIAVMQKRKFVCIHFGGPLDELKVIEVAAGDKNILIKAVEIAEFFLNSGGTAFGPALKKATKVVASQAYQKADVVFITDGQDPVAPKFLVEFLNSKKQREFRVLSVLVQSRDNTILKEFSDEIVKVDELLDAEAEGLMEI
ncbi:MAG: VWA domain-containing protein [Candidatus Methanoperedens sp.]|nr:VWA domain-containing protein [Candidatus Methanoperedens sp.]